MTTANSAPAGPRSQHWHAEGFRMPVLVYKSSRNERCATCGHRGAIHAVWTNTRDDGFSGAPAHFCDDHRPAKGTLPDLDYERITSDRGAWPAPAPDSFTVTYERLTPNAAWPCTTCGQPSAVRRDLRCGHCTNPPRYTVSTLHRLRIDASGTSEDTITSLGHDEHTIAETFHCEEHR
jgi:hypothetical protein